MTRLVPLLFKQQGDTLCCPDCGADGVRLPIVDDAALSTYERLVSPMDAAAPHVPQRFLAGGLILSCALCENKHRADLDHAEDPTTLVWRISRVEGEDDA